MNVKITYFTQVDYVPATLIEFKPPSHIDEDHEVRTTPCKNLSNSMRVVETWSKLVKYVISLRCYYVATRFSLRLKPHTFPILGTIHHDSSRCDRDASGWLNRKFRNHYDVSRCSYGVSTNPLRFMTVLLRCYYDATMNHTDASRFEKWGES